MFSAVALDGALTDWLLGDSAKALQASNMTDAIVRGMTIGETLRLAEWIRAGSAADISWRWRALTPSNAGERLKLASSLGIRALLTIHRNGYVRELGLNALAQMSDPETIRFFAIRLDDIVPKLRERARVALETRLNDRYASALVTILPLMRRLGNRVRAGASSALRAVESFLLGSQCGRLELLKAIESDERELRFAVLQLLIRCATGRSDVEPWLAKALADPDLRVIRWAAMQVTSSRTSEAVKEKLLTSLDSHTDSFVRRRALLARARSVDGNPYLERALLDPRAIVRQVAREKLHVDSVVTYRTALASRECPTAETLGALAGLAEVGHTDDATCAALWLHDLRPRVQAEAIRCLGILAPDVHRAHFEQLLTSPSSRVRREAERALRRCRQ